MCEEYDDQIGYYQCCPPPPNAATPRDFRTPPPPVIFRGVKNGVKSEISLQLLSVTSFSYTYFITYFISYFNENVLLTIIINRLSSTLKIVLINCQNFDLTNIYSIANLVQGTKIWNNSELSTPAYAAAAAYFGKTPPSFLKYGGVQHDLHDLHDLKIYLLYRNNNNYKNKDILLPSEVY